MNKIRNKGIDDLLREIKSLERLEFCRSRVYMFGYIYKKIDTMTSIREIEV